MKKLIILYVLSVAFVFGYSFPAAASATYVVKQGDSLWKISQQLKVSFSDLLAANSNLKNPALIYPNQVINLPISTETPSSTASSAENAVLQLVNEERAKNGLSALKMSDKLVTLARNKAQDMAVNNYFSHTSPTYGTPFEMLKKYGVKYKTAGENIAAGQKTAEAVMRDWLNSSGHRANILNANYTEIGVGYYAVGRYGTEWVQLFIGN